MSFDDEDARLAHDVMSPLAAIVGYAELLATRKDEELRAEAATAIAAAAEQLRSAVRELVYRNGGPRPRQGMSSDRRAVRLAPQDRRRVMIVDDEPLVRSLLRTTLPSDLFDVWEVSDGEAALNAVSGAAPSLVLLDWQLPRRSGPEVLAELRRRLPTLPVIVLTAARDPKERRLAERLGADVFLTKPFSPLELLAAIEELLGECPLDEQT